jgi:hypothetical protein
MKKFYMILAAIAAMTMTAQAQNWATIDVGDWDNATTYNGSYFDMAPTTFYVAHTGVQMLYTPDLLADMAGKQNVRIKGLTFMFHDETFEEITRNVKIYVQETDATEFAVNEEGVKQFFPFGEENQVWEEERLYDMLYFYGEDYTTAFRFDCPFTPGKGLLVTMVFDAFDDDNCTMGSDYAPFYTSGIRNHAMTYTNNWNSFVDYAAGTDFPNATASLGCGTNVELPVTTIGYNYEEGEVYTETCAAPNGQYVIIDKEKALVTITNNEPDATVHYVVTLDGELVEEGDFTGEVWEYIAVGAGDWKISCVASAPGMNDSEPGGVFFPIAPGQTPVAVDEMMAGKTVSNVRYYNVAGQEMQEANGMTIVVTTYTDGTTSAVKVIK